MAIEAKQNKDSKARNYVLRLIKFRERSEKEIRDKLKEKNYDARIIDEVIAHFKEIKFIDDEELTKGWIDSRIRKPLSLEIIRLELIQKGVKRVIVDKYINEKKSAFDETKALPELISNRLSKLRDKEECRKIKPKLSAYFIRRGFPANVVCEVIDKLLSK